MAARLAVALSMFPIMLSAQQMRDTAPLRYWTAPMYWQPSVAERSTSPRAQINSAQASSSGNALLFIAMTPCRVIDTRAAFNFPAPFGAPSLVGGASRTFPMQASTLCGIPANAAAYSLNITVTPLGGGLGFLTLWPNGAAQPNASTLNNPDALPALANAVIVPAGNDSSGSMNAYASNATDMIVDINGYYASPTNPSTNSTAIGSGALVANTGTDNTATGYQALQSNTTGSINTADGAQALANNTSGISNTAEGFQALNANTTGQSNTAAGAGALSSNNTGTNNTASGATALFSNTTGTDNTAVGQGTMVNNTTGNYNTAMGQVALQDNTTGNYNVAMGQNALLDNGAGDVNTAIGFDALDSNTTGSYNIGVGFAAGSNITTGLRNIDIGTSGSSNESYTIRIGAVGTQTSFFAAGVYGFASSGGIPVYINSNGQLGTILSSARFKEDILDMADASSGLFRLRPVTFRYKQPAPDGSKPLDYGLIAEEVARIYPDLVVRGSDGKIETVQYQKLTPMLLNEVQKQHHEIESQSEAIRSLKAELAAVTILLQNPAGK